MSTSLATGLESMCATHWSKLCFHFAHVLIPWNTEIKDVRLIDFAEEISKQMYNDNQEQKSMEIFQFYQKGSSQRIAPKGEQDCCKEKCQKDVKYFFGIMEKVV